MTPLELAGRYLGKFKQKGAEIIPEYCPFCKGGNHGDKNTFALNMQSGVYNCRRGSCGVTGTFNQLLKHFGEQAAFSPNYEIAPAKLREFIRPKSTVTPAQKKVNDYLTKRGFSKETWERRGVGEVEGNIAFPYLEGGQVVLMKFRKPEKYTGQGQKAWREKGGKAVFWGMDNCNPGLPLVITEGEFDALALDECGVGNVVSVPSGAEDLTCIDNCWDWVNQFKQVIIWPDNDEPGQEMCRKLIARLGAWRCLVVKSPHKDANESLYRAGKDATKAAVYSADYVPIAGLVRLVDVAAYDPTKEKRALSTVNKINEVMGGYAMGQLSVWTGINGSGKSTFLGQELLYSIKQGFPVMAYSGELPAAVFRYIVELQAAGPDGLETATDAAGRTTYRATYELQKQIRQWYSSSFYLLDSFGAVTADNLIEVFEYAARRHDCQVFLVDNLMTTSFAGGESEFYRKQSETVGKLKEFAHRYNVHIHLVAHPRKAEGKLTKFDVAGTGDIVNRCDNLFSLYRCSMQELMEQQCAAKVTVLKNRYSGRQDTEINLQFEPNCRRYWRADDPNKANMQIWG